MICLECDNKEFFTVKDRPLKQEFRGETFVMLSPATVCDHCGWTGIDADQAEELRRRVADEYRKTHNLLTSSDIKAIRACLQMSQVEFAKFLCVGEASVKRWETWLVQDKSSDELIRLKIKMAGKASTNPGHL